MCSPTSACTFDQRLAMPISPAHSSNTCAVPGKLIAQALAKIGVKFFRLFLHEIAKARFLFPIIHRSPSHRQRLCAAHNKLNQGITARFFQEFCLCILQPDFKCAVTISRRKMPDPVVQRKVIYSPQRTSRGTPGPFLPVLSTYVTPRPWEQTRHRFSLKSIGRIPSFTHPSCVPYR